MRTLTQVVVALLLMGGSASLQGPRPQDVEMQAAIRTETIDGNLDKAIELYTELTKTYANDRQTVATALIRLAGCYQKRGDSQAKEIYQRIVREFSDQKDAFAVAKSMLGERGRQAGMTYKRIWPASSMARGLEFNGTVSPDGRYLSYVDWNGGDLMLRDLLAGTDRRLTGTGKWPTSNEFAEASAISRDGKRVAYAWYNGKDRYQLRVAGLNATPLEPQVVLERQEIDWVAPHDWSPDGRSVVVELTRDQRDNRKTEVALVGLNDGSIRTLAVADWRGISKATLSPDGRWLAFDKAVGKPADEERDIYLVAIEGGEERVLISNPGLERVVGWSPNGDSLLFASDRAGSLGLWTQPVTEGVARGVSSLVKPEIGSGSLGVTPTGELFVKQQVAGRNIYVAEVDFATGRVVKAAERVSDRFVGMHEWPDWSRDGKLLSYVYARNWMGRSPTIAIKSLEGGQVRELPLDVINGRTPLWAPDGESFVTQGVNADGKAGIFRIAARDGTVTPIALSGSNEFFAHPEFSPDGRKVYFARRANNAGSVVEYDIASGRLREVISGAAPGAVAPDGKSVAAVKRTADGSAIVVASLIDASEPRDILHVTRPQALLSPSWAPDGRALMVNTFWNDSDRRETWLVPLDGGPHRVLDLPGYTWGRMRVHPDGKRVAYHAGELKSEVWVLENFLPR